MSLDVSVNSLLPGSTITSKHKSFEVSKINIYLQTDHRTFLLEKNCLTGGHSRPILKSSRSLGGSGYYDIWAAYGGRFGSYLLLHISPHRLIFGKNKFYFSVML